MPAPVHGWWERRDPLGVGDRVMIRGARGVVEGQVIGAAALPDLPVVPGFDLSGVGVVRELLEERGVCFVAVLTYEFQARVGLRQLVFVALRQCDGRWVDLRGQWLSLFRYAGDRGVTPWEVV